MTGQSIEKSSSRKFLLIGLRICWSYAAWVPAPMTFASIEDNPRNFYLWGAMGQAVPVAIGLAAAQPDKRVLVITGDGEMLMGLGALSVAGNAPVRNLAVLVDNGHYS